MWQHSDYPPFLHLSIYTFAAKSTEQRGIMLINPPFREIQNARSQHVTGVRCPACILSDPRERLVSLCSAGAAQLEADHRDSRCYIRHHHGLAVRLDLGIQAVGVIAAVLSCSRSPLLTPAALNFVLNVVGNQTRHHALSLSINESSSKQNCQYDSECYPRPMLARCEDSPPAHGEQPGNTKCPALPVTCPFLNSRLSF